jgi:hypothetical protein
MEPGYAPIVATSAGPTVGVGAAVVTTLVGAAVGGTDVDTRTPHAMRVPLGVCTTRACPKLLDSG